jgi:tRNA (guanine37-N1)-methyltransferase
VRVDVVTIFPEWFAVLDVSLIGKARASGLVDITVHDLRAWTRDRHRTVDDTPYGGGAGMVMRPEPWGEALDALRSGGSAARPTLVVPSPSGTPLRQAMARDLATVEHLVFACGRYEGIDQRVVEEAATTYDVREVSLGDYVLNGGEVATLVVLEAVVRLLPGFLGNPSSLEEESHEDGLLEYPVYTKPATWRGREVPPVLLSGDHGAIAAWRHAESVRRTVARRPDLAHASTQVGLGGIELDIRPATRADAGEIFTLTRACWLQELEANPGVMIPALEESFDDFLSSLDEWTTLVARAGGRLVGSCRGRLDGAVWDIGRVMVAPDLQGRGIGRHLLEVAERAAPAAASSYRLVTGAGSSANIRRYKKAGYRMTGPHTGAPGAIALTKRRG